MFLYYTLCHHNGKESLAALHPTFGDCAGIQYEQEHAGLDHHGKVQIHSRGFVSFIYVGF